MTEREAWLALAQAPGLTAGSLDRLLNDFGSAVSVRGAARAALRAAGLRDTTIDVLHKPDPELTDRAMTWLDAGPDSRHLVTWGESRFPAQLRQIADPPIALFVTGDPTLLDDPQLAIVGSRSPSAGGRDNAFRFAAHLARCGLLITSGMALGIDTESHKGALSVSMPTIAVLGTGPDIIYPTENRSLAGEITTHGALVTELFPGTGPARHTFPRRNRIISGLATGVLVVEASLRSGSLITARLAGEQGREVFAIPGSIHNPVARGCHRIIREGAKLVESVDDILFELAGVLQNPPDKTPVTEQDTNTTANALDHDYLTLLDACGTDPVTVDQVAERTKLTTAEVSSMLLILELQGLVESGPGGRYTRVSKGT